MKKRGPERPASAPDWDSIALRSPDRPGSTIALWSIWEAHDANPALLARRLRQGNASPEEMALAADLIEKKIKPRHPRSGKPTRMTNDAITQVVLYIEANHPDWPRSKTIIPDVAKAFRVSQKHVYNVLAKRRNTWTEFPTAHFVEHFFARK